MTPRERQNMIRRLKTLGFDESRSSDGCVRVKCSQCQAMVVNGMPIHEQGCPHEKK